MKSNKHTADPFGSFRNLNIKKFLDSQWISLFVAHHGAIVETVEVGQSLKVRFVLNELFCGPVEKSDVRICTHDCLHRTIRGQQVHLGTVHIFWWKIQDFPQESQKIRFCQKVSERAELIRTSGLQRRKVGKPATQYNLQNKLFPQIGTIWNLFLTLPWKIKLKPLKWYTGAVEVWFLFLLLPICL